MGLGPGKGCMVGSADKETKMDGTPLKARHPLSPEIARLVAEHRPGGPLERDFYVASEVFAADLARIFHRHWIFAGYAFQVPRPGDFFTYKVGTESVIVRARPRGRDPRLSQCLPPSRLAHLQDRAGQRPSPGLPLSPLDLRARRRAGARHVARVRRRPAPSCRCGRSPSRTPPACCSSRSADDAARLLRRRWPPSGAR